MTPVEEIRAYIEGELERIRYRVEMLESDALTETQKSALALGFTVEAQTLYFMERELDRIEGR